MKRGMSAVGAARVTTSISSSGPYVRLRRSPCTLSVRADRKKRKVENDTNLYTTTNFFAIAVGLRARQLSVLLTASDQQSDRLKDGRRAPPYGVHRSVASITCGLYQNGYNGNDRSARQTLGVAG